MRNFALVFVILFFFLSLLSRPSLAQQFYEANNPQLNCFAAPSNTSTVLGYSCNSSPSCSAYLTFRSRTNYRTPSQISSLLNSTPSAIARLNNNAAQFPAGDLVLVPAPCACADNRIHYQHAASYTVKVTGETYLTIANDTYGGLSTCQAIMAHNPYDSRSLVAGMEIAVPLRCACPTAAQTKAGTKYLLTYLITWGDDVPTIAKRFGADLQAVLDANSLSSNEVIYPFTTLLVPIKSEPTAD